MQNDEFLQLKNCEEPKNFQTICIFLTLRGKMVKKITSNVILNLKKKTQKMINMQNYGEILFIKSLYASKLFKNQYFTYKV